MSDYTPQVKAILKEINVILLDMVKAITKFGIIQFEWRYLRVKYQYSIIYKLNIQGYANMQLNHNLT